MFQHLSEPIFVDVRQDFQVKLFYDEDGKSIVAEFEKQLDYVFSFELLKLLVSDRSSELWRVAHFCQDCTVLCDVNISVRVEVRWVTKLPCE